MRNSKMRSLQDQNIPEYLRPWLYASGSLTQQLTTVAGGQFHVEPSNEHFQALKRSDAMWMNMPLQHTSWVRESLLFGNEQQAWVKAKSIFPILSLQKKARIFQHIGRKPIGRFLFQRTNPRCERRVLLLEDGWTRQSCYTWHGCKFIVQETFLASFEQFLQRR